MVLVSTLTLNAPITTAEDDTFCDIFHNFQKYRLTVDIMPYLLFFEKAAQFEIVVCCKL